MSEIPEGMGQFVSKRQYSLSQSFYQWYWPGMDGDTEKYIRNCPRCIRRKSKTSTPAKLVVDTTYPMDLVCMDFLSLEMSSGGYEHVLVITDHFTRYAQAIPSRNQTAKTTAKLIFDNFVGHYGFPARLHSDQGRNFESQVIKKVQVGKDQEKAQSEKDSHSKNRGGKKPNQQSGTYTMKHIVSRMSSYFPNRWPLSYLNLTKNMKTYIRRQQHKNFKHQDI